MKTLFLTHNPHEVHLEWAKAIDAKVKIIPFDKLVNLSKKYRFLNYLYPLISLAYSFFVKVEEDIILVEGGSSLYTAVFLKMRRGNIKIVYLDCDIYFYNWGRKNFLVNKIKKYFVNKIDGVISVSEQNKKMLGRKIKKPSAVVNPYPKKITNKNKKRENTGLYIGRLDPDKNIKNMINYVLQCPYLDKFRIVGDGALKKYVEKISKKEKKIEYLGFDQNVEKHYNKNKILLHLAEYDPCTCTTMEAALGGCYPILSKGIGSKYLFNEMFIVNPRNYTEINKKIKYVLENENEAKKELDKTIKKIPVKEDTIKDFKKVYKEITRNFVK